MAKRKAGHKDLADLVVWALEQAVARAVAACPYRTAPGESVTITLSLDLPEGHPETQALIDHLERPYRDHPVTFRVAFRPVTFLP